MLFVDNKNGDLLLKKSDAIQKNTYTDITFYLSCAFALKQTQCG